MAHNMTPRRALRLAHFVQAALSLEASSGHIWQEMAADAERWALASLAGSRTKIVVAEADGSAHMDLTSYNARVLAQQVRAICGFTA